MQKVKPVIVGLGTGIKQQGCGGSKQKKMGNLSSTWENMIPVLEYATIFKDADASVLRVLHPVPPKKANLIGDFLVKTLQSKMKQSKNPSKSLHCQDDVHTFLWLRESFPGPSPAHHRYRLPLLYRAGLPHLLPRFTLCLRRSFQYLRPFNHSSLPPRRLPVPWG